MGDGEQLASASTGRSASPGGNFFPLPHRRGAGVLIRSAGRSLRQTVYDVSSPRSDRFAVVLGAPGLRWTFFALTEQVSCGLGHRTVGSDRFAAVLGTPGLRWTFFVLTEQVPWGLGHRTVGSDRFAVVLGAPGLRWTVFARRRATPREKLPASGVGAGLVPARISGTVIRGGRGSAGR